MRVKIIKNARHGKQRQVGFAILCDGIQKDRVFLVFLAGEFMAIWWNELPRERKRIELSLLQSSNVCYSFWFYPYIYPLEFEDENM